MFGNSYLKPRGLQPMPNPQTIKQFLEAATKVRTPVGLLALIIGAVVIVAVLVLRSGKKLSKPHMNIAFALLLTIVVIAIVPYASELILSSRKASAESSAIYRLRITLVGPEGVPIEGASIWTSVGGETKTVAGGYQVDIPRASLPADRRITIFGEKQSSFLKSTRELVLADDLNPTVVFRLLPTPSAAVRGLVEDASGKAQPDVLVMIAGYGTEAVRTAADGSFALAAHASEGQQVQLHAEKRGYKPLDQWHPAGSEPATLVLERSR